LPAALASATYDAANQIATWSSTSFTYDDNGNLTNDGAKTYSWNARNQLTGLSGGVGASFQYDGLGRRRAKTVSGASTGFLYDGLNAVQELTSGSPSANILPGLGIDEWLTRTDGAGARHFLTDALGSTVALTDGSGTVQTEYTYEPFGKATVTGASSANGLQFTGRENDGTGLFSYRARYVHPELHRFTAEDPIGFAGGEENLHAYVGNRPTTFLDPLGLIITPAPPGCQPAKGKDLSPFQWLRCTQIPFVPLPLLLPRAVPLLSPAGPVTPPAGTPRPPGYRPGDPGWRYDYPEGLRHREPRWFDPKGGEWRHHPADRWHSQPHWDYRPWTEWNSPKYRIYPVKPVGP
jgi:RHS repeat-associated protein